MIAAWQLTAQILQVVIYKKMSIEEISIAFLTADFLRLCLIDLVIVWVCYMLNLLHLLKSVALNFAAYCRISESMEFFHELKMDLNAGLRSRNELYLHHIVKHAYTGINAGNSDFFIDLFCFGELQLSRLLGSKIPQIVPGIFQILVIEELAPNSFMLDENITLNMVQIVAILAFTFSMNFGLVRAILETSTGWIYRLWLSENGILNKILAEDNKKVPAKVHQKAEENKNQK